MGLVVKEKKERSRGYGRNREREGGGWGEWGTKVAKSTFYHR